MVVIFVLLMTNKIEYPFILTGHLDFLHCGILVEIFCVLPREMSLSCGMSVLFVLSYRNALYILVTSLLSIYIIVFCLFIALTVT